MRIDDNAFMKTSDKNHRFYCIAHLDNLKYLDYTLIEKSDREKAKDDHKDEINEGVGGADKPEGEGAAIDQELVDARIDNTFQLLDSVMRESEDFNRVFPLPNYNDLFSTSDNAIDEKW